MTVPIHIGTVVTRHDRFVRAMRLLLPAFAAILALLTFLWPLLGAGEDSFVLRRESMQRGGEEVRIVAPVYRGTDNRDRAFALHAAEALQSSADTPVVGLADMRAEMALADDRQATVSAGNGRYDKDAATVEVPGKVSLETSDGYNLEASAARLALGEKTLSSSEPVSGKTPLGQISADGFEIDIDERKAVFEGRVRLRTTPAPRG